MRRLTLLAVLVPIIASAVSACHRDAAASAGKATAPAPAAMNGMKTLPADTDPCSWITTAEAAQLLGPLAGAPWRASHADGPEPAATGHACGYTLAAAGGDTPGEDRIAVELVTEDVTTFDAGFGMVKERLNKDVGRSVAGQAFDALGADQPTPEGWDFTTRLPEMFVGRVGSIAVQVGVYTRRVPGDSIQRLAAVIRDRVPDLPIATPSKLLNRGNGPDPCGLLTREEAETVLGKLTMAPYRSNSHKYGFSDPGGEGCSYYLGKHRIFTIMPTWEDGKTTFQVSSSTSRMFSSAAGGKGESADTLDGPWDAAAAGSGGVLYFLKGDRALEVVYGTARADLAGAVNLAATAVKRLESF